MPKPLSRAYLRELRTVLATEQKSVSKETLAEVMSDIERCEEVESGSLYSITTMALAHGVTSKMILTRSCPTNNRYHGSLRRLGRWKYGTWFAALALMGPSLSYVGWLDARDGKEALALAHRIVRLRELPRKYSQTQLDKWRQSKDGQAIRTL